MDIFYENSKHQYMCSSYRASCVTCTLAQVINSGWVGLVLTALLQRDKGNPAIIFSEQGILISTPVRREKAEIICKGLSSSAALPSLQPKQCPCIHRDKAISDNGGGEKKELLMEREEAEVRQ